MFRWISETFGVRRGGATVVVDGVTYRCARDLEIDGRRVLVDGGEVGTARSEVVTVRVTEGRLVNLKVRGDVTAGDVEGGVSASGDVACGDVRGGVTAKGNVICKRIGGGIVAGGDVIGRAG